MGLSRSAAGLIAAICFGGAALGAPVRAEEKTGSLPAPAAPAFAQTGLASFYTPRGKTSSGAKVDPRALTAAHRKLPFGTRVRVTHLKTGKEVVVVITDRGPFRGGRIIDISREAAKALEMTKTGVARVRITLAD
ncbi:MULTISPECIES: septal ring lytic transglycosylase RlpA family protein [Rhodomicrobium]|uniref:septal ring lytic transglycosylase RlpA family protein n=1 Tax=Rhodomicrobium TaxID=1068 RepID=UPI000B4B6E97|nr:MULTISPECIES: septal ring lytic transglycosylase RlpA family protein [Rhodomicrobium]